MSETKPFTGAKGEDPEEYIKQVESTFPQDKNYMSRQRRAYLRLGLKGLAGKWINSLSGSEQKKLQDWDHLKKTFLEKFKTSTKDFQNSELEKTLNVLVYSGPSQLQQSESETLLAYLDRADKSRSRRQAPLPKEGMQLIAGVRSLEIRRMAQLAMHIIIPKIQDSYSDARDILGKIYFAELDWQADVDFTQLQQGKTESMLVYLDRAHSLYSKLETPRPDGGTRLIQGLSSPELRRMARLKMHLAQENANSYDYARYIIKKLHQAENDCKIDADFSQLKQNGTESLLVYLDRANDLHSKLHISRLDGGMRLVMGMRNLKQRRLAQKMLFAENGKSYEDVRSILTKLCQKK